jgi:ABC-type nitrate/sulfonate/bicarbonate transport system substrate-binding protein
VAARLFAARRTSPAAPRGTGGPATTTDAVPEYMFGTIAVRRDWARQDHDLVVRFIRGYQDGLAWIYDPVNREKVIAYWVDISKSSPDAATKTYDEYIVGPLRGKVLPEQARISRPAMQAVIDLMTESNILQRPLTLDEVVDYSYLEEASRR